ncbi:MAG: STAS domain-containing protein [Candidatus Competibacterales bacterium]|nr:STAS domain-containing protein [Candidatus Competibacterales bacterium]
MSVGAIYYAKQGRTYVLKFIGDIRYTMSCSLDQFLERLFDDSDFDAIAIDLTGVTAIDSTNLGLLAKVANQMRRRSSTKQSLHSTNPEVNQVLLSMGLEDVFELCFDNDCRSCPKTIRLLQISDPSKDEMARTMLDAHCVLSDLNDNNRREFRQVVSTLRRRTSGASS